MEKHLMTPEKTLMGKMFKKKWFRELLLLVPTITGARSSNKTEDYGIFKVSKLSHLQQLSIYVSDWGKSIKWYETVAGLTVSRTCASEPHPTLAGHTIRCCYLSATRHPECLVLIEHKDEGGNIVKPTVHDFFHTAFELDGSEDCCYDFDKEIRPVLKQNGYKGVSYGLVRHNSTPPDGDGESGGNVATYIYDPDLHFIEFFSGMDTVENYQQRYGNKTGSQRV
jgi:hypothetical protein